MLVFFFFNISDVSDVKLVAGGAIVIFCVTVGEDSLAMMTQDNVFVGTKLYATKPVSTQNHEDEKKCVILSFFFFHFPYCL